VKAGLNGPSIERHGEVAERVSRVRGPVVNGLRAKRLQPVIVFGAVELERVDPARAFLCIEPSFWNEHTDGVYAVLDSMQRRKR
jgi:hypothetical protein